MSNLYTKSALRTLLAGLLQDPLGGETVFASHDLTSGTRVTVTRTVPNGYGGSASISLDMQLPTGEEAFIGYFHLLNLSLGNLMDSLSSSLNILQRGRALTSDTLSSSSPQGEQKDVEDIV